jgi:hypothetical protein
LPTFLSFSLNSPLEEAIAKIVCCKQRKVVDRFDRRRPRMPQQQQQFRQQEQQGNMSGGRHFCVVL